MPTLLEMVSQSLAFKRYAGAGFATLVLLAALVGVTSKLWQFGVASPFTDPLDFRAFYCAGAALAQRENPYRLEPDRTCQREVLAAAGLRLNENFVLPAPLPPYALSVFAGLALLPYRLAATIWMSTNVLALIGAILLIGRLSRARPAYVAFSLFLSAGIVCLSLGQPVPIVLAALLFAALCARRENGNGAAAGAAIAAIEPHLALPVWLALALFVPVARKPLALAAGILSAITLLAGVGLNVEYVRSVLPDHARAELLNLEGQYGLSALLAAAHVPYTLALRAGTTCYVVMLLFGLILGVALERRFADAAYLVLAPLAAVVLGGPFLHIQQTVVAIPLGFMLLLRLPRYSAATGAVIFAIVLLAIPWPLTDMLSAPRPVATLQAKAVPVPPRVSNPEPDESIETPYTAFLVRFERRTDKHTDSELIARKLPTWFALIYLLLTASWLAYGPLRVGPVPTHELRTT